MRQLARGRDDEGVRPTVGALVATALLGGRAGGWLGRPAFAAGIPRGAVVAGGILGGGLVPLGSLVCEPADELQRRQGERGGLPGACLRGGNDVTPLQDERDGLALDRRGLGVAQGLDASKYLLVKPELGK